MYGDACVGEGCIKMIDIAKAKFDVVCKFSGSGGCFVCMLGGEGNAGNRLSRDMLGRVQSEFEVNGFTFDEIIVR